MKIIKEVLYNLYNNPTMRRTQVPLFLGNPGLGKSYIVKEFAKEVGVNLVQFISSARNPFEISGISMPNRDTKKMGFWDFDTLLNMKDGDILFFDELLNGSPAVLNACLTLLEDRVMISGKPLADIIIVAAANPQGMCPLTPQIKERFVWWDVEFDRDSWKEYMIGKYEVTDTIANRLIQLIEKEDFTGYNFNTPRSLDKAVYTLIANKLTPYKDRLVPILNEVIPNYTGRDLDIGIELSKDGSISWLKLMQLKNEIIEKQKA